MSEWSFLRSPRWAGLPRARDRVRDRVLRARHVAAEPARRGPRRGRPHRRELRRRRRSPSPRRCPTPTAFDVDQRWQVVALSGEYLVDEEVVVRNRPVRGQLGLRGDHAVPPRRRHGVHGRPRLDRAGVRRPAERVRRAARPATSRSTARLKAGEERIAGRTSTGIEFATIDLDELAERVGEPSYTGAYGVLVQSGADADEPPLAAARPVRDEGPHLSYALQWFVFALLGVRRARVGREPGAARARGGIRSRCTRAGRPREPTRPKREKRDEDADVEADPRPD